MVANTMTWMKELPAGLLAFLCLIVTGSLLGLTANLAKVAVDGDLGPLAFLTWSLTGAALILVFLKAVQGGLPRLNGRTLEYFLIAGLISLAAPNLIFFAAVEHVGVSFVALAIAFPPLLTYVGALALRMEMFSTKRAAGVMAALSGAALLAIYKLSEPDASALWIVLTLLGPVFLAAGNLYRSLRWPEGARPDQLAPGMLGGAAILLILFGLAPGRSLAVPDADTFAIGLITLQAVLFAGQYIVFFQLQKLGGPVYLSLIGSVAALVGVPVAVFGLGEAPPEGLIPAAVLIGLGVYLVSKGNGKPKPEPAQ